MDEDAFKGELARQNMTQIGLARLLRHLGDTSSETAARRRVEAWAAGRTKVPGETVALLTVFRRFPAVLGKLRGEMG